MRIVDDWASRISWRWGVTAIVVLVTALVVGVVVVLMPRGESVAVATASSDSGPVRLLPPASAGATPSLTSSTTPSTPSSTTPSNPPTTTPSKAPPSTPIPSSSISIPLTPADVVATTQPAVSGPGVTEPGISIWVTPQLDGSLEVMEAALYPDPVDVVTLDPVDVHNGGPAFAALVPTVTHLQVTADQTPVGVLESMTRPTTVTLPTRARQLLLRYHLDGVTVRSTPSATGRASILIAPLSAGSAAALQSQIRIGGGPVLNLTCPRLHGDAASCVPISGDLGVAPVLPARDDVVVAQVDLPSPS